MSSQGELFLYEYKLNLHSLARDLSENDESLKAVLEKENIISIITGKMNRSKLNIKVFAITDYATLISFTYCFQKNQIKVNRRGSVMQEQAQTRFLKLKEYGIRNLSISDHLKQMTGFKISRVIASKNYPI